MTTSTSSASMDMRSLLHRGDARSGPVRRWQDCDGTRQRLLAVKLLIRPTSPAGAVPAAAGGQGPLKARSQSLGGGTPPPARGQLTSYEPTPPDSQSLIHRPAVDRLVAVHVLDVAAEHLAQRVPAVQRLGVLVDLADRLHLPLRAVAVGGAPALDRAEQPVAHGGVDAPLGQTLLG